MMGKKSEPSINMWQALERFKVYLNGVEIIINKHELLFLLDQDSCFYTFKTERGDIIKVSIKAKKEKKIDKVL